MKKETGTIAVIGTDAMNNAPAKSFTKWLLKQSLIVGGKGSHLPSN